jgi:hypothetical protein
MKQTYLWYPLFLVPLGKVEVITSKILRSPPILGWSLWNICITNDHGYVPLVVSTSLEQIGSINPYTCILIQTFFAMILKNIFTLYFVKINLPFICSNIPAAPAYGVYIFQLIRYSRACGSYQDLVIWPVYQVI